MAAYAHNPSASADAYDAEERLQEVLAAVEAHRHDISDDADARLYARVFGPARADIRVDDPNDWPEP
jgi:hypothetical protein